MNAKDFRELVEFPLAIIGAFTVGKWTADLIIWLFT